MSPQASPIQRSGGLAVRLLRAGIGPLAALIGLGLSPGEVHGQARSTPAQVALVAYKAPGVALGRTASGLAYESVADMGGMRVNTAYRVELRRAGQDPVVLLHQAPAGLVPWTELRARLDDFDDGPLVVSLILTPTL
jgi:hypothetical protein